MKAILLPDGLQILGPGTSFQVEDERFVLADQNDSVRYLPFSGYPALQKRLEKDPLFKQLLPKLVQHVFVNFLTHNSPVLDIESLLIQLTVDQAPNVKA